MIALFVFSFLLGFLLSLSLIPLIIKISFKKGFFDKPDERKIHISKNIPRLGGLCFLPVLAIVMTVVLSIGYKMSAPWILDVFNQHESHFLYGMISAFILFCFGALDDLWGVRYRTKFVGQILAGVLLCVSGLWISDLQGLFGLKTIPPVVGYPITIFAIVYITNAINFIDGIDGLASSICLMALIYFSVAFYSIGLYDYSLIALVIAGPVLGFMLFNLFGKPENHTKIFMGDTGSMFLGFVLSVLGIALNKYLDGSVSQNYNAFVMGFAPVILPCFDVLRVVFVRKRLGRNTFYADKNHIHHKFLSLGLSPYTVLLIVDFLTIIFAAIAIILSKYVNVNITLVVLLLLWTVMHVLLPNHFNESNEE